MLLNSSWISQLAHQSCRMMLFDGEDVVNLLVTKAARDPSLQINNTETPFWLIQGLSQVLVFIPKLIFMVA